MSFSEVATLKEKIARMEEDIRDLQERADKGPGRNWRALESSSGLRYLYVPTGTISDPIGQK